MRKYKDVVGSFWLPVPGFTGALWPVLGLGCCASSTVLLQDFLTHGRA